MSNNNDANNKEMSKRLTNFPKAAEQDTSGTRNVF